MTIWNPKILYFTGDFRRDWCVPEKKTVPCLRWTRFVPWRSRSCTSDGRLPVWWGPTCTGTHWARRRGRWKTTRPKRLSVAFPGRTAERTAGPSAASRRPRNGRIGPVPPPPPQTVRRPRAPTTAVWRPTSRSCPWARGASRATSSRRRVSRRVYRTEFLDVFPWQRRRC